MLRRAQHDKGPDSHGFFAGFSGLAAIIAAMNALQPLVLSLQSDGSAVFPHEWHGRFMSLYDAPHIVVDMSGLTVLKEHFLAELALMRAHRRAARSLLGRLVVPSKAVRASLERVGFAQHWPIFETLEEALASFDGPEIYA